jgi:hypothetical protein
VDLTIDTASREEAELIAALLPHEVEAKSVRGFGFIRLRCRSMAETQSILDTVRAGAEHHGVSWIRVRWEDEERVFRRGRPCF